MKSVFGYALLFVSLTACYTPKKDCKKYHTGSFEYQALIDGKLQTAKIKRTDSFLIDYSHKIPDTSTVRWINNCTYIVTKYHPKTLQDKQAYQVRIITTDKDSYTFEFSKVGGTKAKTFTAKRIPPITK